VKKLFPETPDVPQTMANRAARIIEKHMRMHRVDKARDLPEEARIRLYRDLRFLFDGGDQPPVSGSESKGFSLRRSFSRFWEKLEDFLSACEAESAYGGVNVFAWAPFGESMRIAVTPLCRWPLNTGASG